MVLESFHRNERLLSKEALLDSDCITYNSAPGPNALLDSAAFHGSFEAMFLFDKEGEDMTWYDEVFFSQETLSCGRWFSKVSKNSYFDLLCLFGTFWDYFHKLRDI